MVAHMKLCAAVVCCGVLVRAYDNGAPLSRMPPLGWSSWNSLGPNWSGATAGAPQHDYCDAASVMQSIDAYIDVGLYDAGYRHFHLDDCWSAFTRNASGYLRANPLKFPQGMKAIVDYAHAKNLTFGLYLDAGTKTCHDGLPGSKDHWVQDADLMASWGVDWVKMGGLPFCRFACPCRRATPCDCSHPSSFILTRIRVGTCRLVPHQRR